MRFPLVHVGRWFVLLLAMAVTACAPGNSSASAPAASAGEAAVELPPVVPGHSLARQVAEHLRAAAAAELDPARREALLDQAAQGIPRGLYGELLKELGTPPPGSIEAEAQRAILLRWAWQEPTDAAAWALRQPPGELRKETLGAAAARWADQQPAQVLQWAGTLEPAERAWVLLRGGDGLARSDPDIFALWHQALSPSRERDRLTLQAAQLWAQRDPAALASALQQHDGPEFSDWRSATLAGLVNQLSQLDGAAAAQWVADKIPAGPLQQSAAVGIAAAWSQRDPSTAALWVDSFPAMDVRAAASAALLGNWLEQDRSAAEAWATQLPEGAVADAAADRAAQFFASRDPQVGIGWAERMSDPARRTAAMSFVVEEWLRADPTAARAWLDERPERAGLAPL